MDVSCTARRSSLRSLPLLGVLFGILVPTFLIAPRAQAQDRRSQPPRVYIDCDRCDYNHIRREVTMVRYVREPEQADVHVFVTVEGTGGGGERYSFSFLGRRDFEGIDYSFTQTIDRDATDDDAREEVNRVLEMGLSPYLMQTSIGESLSLEYPERAPDQSSQDTTEDPWNYWVFDIYGGRVRMSYESNQSEFRSRWGFYADRVTDTWKTRVRPYFNFSFTRIDQEGEEPITSRTHRHGINSYAIRSLNQHWSVGLFSDYITRTDRNLEHRVRLNPGVEYSLFPYEEATRRSVTFTYQLGLTMVDYYEKTIFLRTSERLANHELEASVSFEQPWGAVDAGVVGAHYFHDVSRYRAEVFGSASIRVVEGLSLNFSGSVERIQDQLSLPLGDTSAEDVLLGQRELATDVSVNGSISLSYTFGSDFADVVNTRF